LAFAQSKREDYELCYARRANHLSRNCGEKARKIAICALLIGMRAAVPKEHSGADTIRKQ
jgi:hypothetical protein